MANTSIYNAFERMWTHVVNALSSKADTDHNHDDVYYTETETDKKLNLKMDKDDPTGTGSFSLNRKSGTTVGAYSVAIGLDTYASGYASYSEGTGSDASGKGAHAEGEASWAAGDYSHAEGSSITSGKYSHAEGLFTKALSEAQHTEGRYNIPDSAGIYAHILGNGTSSDDTSNAHTVDWSGNAWFAGDLTAKSVYSEYTEEGEEWVDEITGESGIYYYTWKSYLDKGKFTSTYTDPSSSNEYKIICNGSNLNMYLDDEVYLETYIDSDDAAIKVGSSTFTKIPKFNLQTSTHHGLLQIDNSGYFGLYDATNAKWLIYSDATGKIKLSSLSSSVIVSYDDTTQAQVQVKNSLHNGMIQVSTSGNFGLFDNLHTKWLIYSDVDGYIKLGSALYEPTLAWRFGDGTTTNPHVEMRRMGSSGSYTMGMTYTASDGTVSYYNIINADGTLNLALKSHTHSYLPLSGGTLTGALTVNSSVSASGGFKSGSSVYGSLSVELYGATPFIDFHAGNSTNDYTSRIIESASGTLKIITSTYLLLQASGFSIRIGDGLTSGNDVLIPVTTGNAAYDGKVYLGASASRWIRVHTVEGVSSTSDERDKDIIGDIDQRYLNMFMDLKPILYRFKDNQQTIHMGVGAQTTEQIANSYGLYENDLGIINHDYWDEPNDDGRVDRYGMNYAELSVLCIPFVQKHETKITALEEENALLKERVAVLENQIQKLIA